MKIKTKAVAAVMTAALITAPFAAQVSAATEQCTDPEMLVSSRAGRSIQISGSDVSHTSMSRLWEIVTRDPDYSTPLLGRVIAADQNWLGSCKYPGIGLGVGSGTSWATRNVAVWVWADEVDLSVARRSILVSIGEIEATTTTTSTTTSTTSTTTTVPPTTTTTLPEQTTTTTTTTVAATTTTTVAVELIASAAVMRLQMQAPVVAASAKVVLKTTSAPVKKKVCKTVKVKKKKKVVCK